MKDKYITIRVNEKEREAIDRYVKKRGYKDRTTFIRRLIQESLRTLCLVFFFGLLSGCASVSYLPINQYQAFPSTQSIQILYEKPDKPYLTLGKIIAEDPALGRSDEYLYKKLKQKAMNIGADAIIIENTKPPGADWLGGVIHRLEGLAIKWQQNPLPSSNSFR